MLYRLNFAFWVMRVFTLSWIIFAAIMVEFTLNANHIRGVLAEDSTIAYPSQLLPMLIGLLSLIRIMWLIFKQWRWSEVEASPKGKSKKPMPSIQCTPEQPQSNGLGLQPMPSPAYSQATTVADDGHDHSMTIHRPLHLRLLVAWLPWLSQFDLWTHPRGGHSRLRSTDEEEARHGSSPSFEMRTSYKTVDDMDGIMESGPSSTRTTPMQRASGTMHNHGNRSCGEA